MPDFFAKRYDSQALKVVSAIIVFVFLIPYSASVYSGLSSLFEIVFGIEGWIVMILLAALTALYLFFGGYFATSLSDFIQGIIMIIGVIFMIICYMNSPQVSWDISELVNDPMLTFFPQNRGEGSWIYGSTAALLSLIALTSLGVWALPQTIHKYYAIRDKKAIVQGVFVSTAFALIIGVTAYFSGALSSLFPQSEIVNASDATVIPQMLKIVIPAGLTGIIAALILSASMSTLASVSLASASVVALDLYRGVVNKKASDRKANIILRTMCLVFVLLSVVLAILNEKYNITAIAYMMGISWGSLAGCFIGPYVIGLLWKKVTRSAVWTSIIGTLVLTVALIFVSGYDINGWDCSVATALKSGIGMSPTIGTICMFYSLLSTFIVSLFTKAPKEETVYKAFEMPIENEIV